MADPKCPAIIKFCAVRVTLLDTDGTDAGEFYVSDKTVSLGVTPDISTGQDREVRNGCDCIVAASKAPDILKRFTFQLDQGVLEPALIAMMLGQQAIIDPDNATSVIGVNWIIDQFQCGSPSNVALEGWSSAEDLDHPDPDFPWLHWRWPSTQWQIGPATLGADYTQPQLTGFSQGNTEFGDPYSDLPADGTGKIDSSFFSMWLEAGPPPTAACGTQDIA